MAKYWDARLFCSRERVRRIITYDCVMSADLSHEESNSAIGLVVSISGLLIQQEPRKRSIVTRPFPSQRAGSGYKTMLKCTQEWYNTCGRKSVLFRKLSSFLCCSLASVVCMH